MPRHFAEVDQTGTVLRVIVADSLAWCQDRLGGTWHETHNPSDPPKASELSKDSAVLSRRNYAAIGHRYDAGRNAFIRPKPYNSWTLDEATARYKPPYAMPDDGRIYVWDESRHVSLGNGWVRRTL